MVGELMAQLDHPFYEVARQGAQYIESGRTVHQKFTCAKCGSRQTMGQPNMFFIKGTCEECKHETNLVLAGCNFVVVLDLSGDKPNAT